MATESRWLSAISASGGRCLFRTDSPLPSRRQTRGRCYQETADCANWQMKRTFDVMGSFGCSTRCSNTALSTKTTCTPDSARLPPIRDAGYRSRKSESGSTPISLR